jgi:biopolymer transport protein TolR
MKHPRRRLPWTTMAIVAAILVPCPATAQDVNERAVVISIDKDRQIALNGYSMKESDLGPRLVAIFRTRPEKTVFVKGDPDLEFRDVAKVIDIASGADPDFMKIGLITPKMDHPLFTFMVIAPAATGKTVPVDLYKAQNPRKMATAVSEDAATVTVVRDGKLYLSPGDWLITADSLPQQLKIQLAKEHQHVVYLKADVRALYLNVEDVVENLFAAGIENITLLTDSRPPKGAGTPDRR